MPLSPARSADGRVRYRGAVPQGPELIIILVVILLLFGGAKLPKLARSLGQAQNEFKQGLKEGADKAEQDDKDLRSEQGRPEA
jgi:sec-independent protein translocase protein TatA